MCGRRDPLVANCCTIDGASNSGGLAGILLQAALLAAVVLPLTRHFKLTFGAPTLIAGHNSMRMAVLEDRYSLALAVVGARLMADVLYAWRRPARARRERYYAFAFARRCWSAG